MGITVDARGQGVPPSTWSVIIIIIIIIIIIQYPCTNLETQVGPNYNLL